MTGVRTAQGEISAKYVVICGGMWSRDLASSVGVNLPLHACEHYYVLFESVDGLSPDLPVLRDYDACTYYKYDAGKLLLGAFEPNAKPWGMGVFLKIFVSMRSRETSITSSQYCTMQ